MTAAVDPPSPAAAEPGWELYRSFLAVMEDGSLSAAARSLGIAQPTVGRHVDALEKSLGVALFTRSRSGFAPTATATALRPYAETLRATAAALRRAASGQERHADGVRGTVRVSVSEAIGIEVLPPLLEGLRRRHPGLAIEVAVSDSLVDLLRSDADIAVRMLRPTQEALVARRVGAIELGLYARRSYLARHGTPSTWDELAGHTLIGYDRETPFVRGLAERYPAMRRAAFALRADSNAVQLALLRDGCGIGGCQVNVARADRRLARVLPGLFAFRMDTWVAMHEDLRGSARCRVVFDELAAGLTAYARS